MTVNLNQLNAAEKASRKEDEMNEVATIGHNNPPEETLFFEAETQVNDLYEEASQWLDGDSAKTQEEADALSKLLDLLRKAAKLTDNHRKEEKKPHDDAGKAIQAKYKPLLDKVKLAQDACKKAMQPFLLEQERVRKENEEAARREAEQAEREAREAAESAKSLNDAEKAAEAIQRAQDAEKLVGDIAKDKVHAKGGDRAVGLRTVWETELIDATLAMRHYWASHNSQFREMMIGFAKADVRSGIREIPGFKITETKVV